MSWPEGMNPGLDEEQKQAIRKARQQRADELERWQVGAGKDYLEAIGVTNAPPIVKDKKKAK